MTARALAARQGARDAAIQTRALAQAQTRAALDVQKVTTKAIELAMPGNVIRLGIDRGFSR